MKLRREDGRYDHWCPGCNREHPLPDGWEFNGNLEAPTFRPSFKQGYVEFDSYTPAGAGVGQRHERTCHYIITDGKLEFCSDSWHQLAGQTIPMQDLPT